MYQTKKNNNNKIKFLHNRIPQLVTLEDLNTKLILMRDLQLQPVMGLEHQNLKASQLS